MVNEIMRLIYCINTTTDAGINLELTKVGKTPFIVVYGWKNGLKHTTYEDENGEMITEISKIDFGDSIEFIYTDDIERLCKLKADLEELLAYKKFSENREKRCSINA